MFSVFRLGLTHLSERVLIYTDCQICRETITALYEVNRFIKDIFKVPNKQVIKLQTKTYDKNDNKFKLEDDS